MNDATHSEARSSLVLPLLTLAAADILLKAIASGLPEGQMCGMLYPSMNQSPGSVENVGLMLLITIIVMYSRLGHPLARAVFCYGGLSNTAERVLYDHVTDMIPIPIWHIWPGHVLVINMADIYIVIAGLFLAFQNLKK